MLRLSFVIMIDKMDYFFDGVAITCGMLANVFWIWMLIVQSTKGYKIHLWCLDLRHLNNFRELLFLSNPYIEKINIRLSFMDFIHPF